MILEELKQELSQEGITFQGCTKEEIETLQKWAGDLPQAYVTFLSLMGKSMERPVGGGRGFLVGNTVFYGGDLELNNGPEGLMSLIIEDESSLTIPENAFVFYASQGILYAFFLKDDSADPVIYGYEEGFEGEEFPKIANSFTSFMERMWKGDMTLFNELR